MAFDSENFVAYDPDTGQYISVVNGTPVYYDNQSQAESDYSSRVSQPLVPVTPRSVSPSTSPSSSAMDLVPTNLLDNEVALAHELYLTERLKQLEIPEMQNLDERERINMALQSAIAYSQISGYNIDPQMFSDFIWGGGDPSVAAGAVTAATGADSTAQPLSEFDQAAQYLIGQTQFADDFRDWTDRQNYWNQTKQETEEEAPSGASAYLRDWYHYNAPNTGLNMGGTGQVDDQSIINMAKGQGWASTNMAGTPLTPPSSQLTTPKVAGVQLAGSNYYDPFKAGSSQFGQPTLARDEFNWIKFLNAMNLQANPGYLTSGLTALGVNPSKVLEGSMVKL